MPVQLVELSDTEMYQYAASENAERVALNPLEIAHSIKQASEELNLTQAEAGRLHGYSKTAACNLLRLLQLPEAVQALIASGNLSQRHGRELLRLLQTVPPLRQQCLRQAEYAAAQEMSVTALKEVVDRHLERQVRDQARLAHRETRSCRRCGTEREFTGRELANEWGDFTCEGCFYTARPKRWQTAPVFDQAEKERVSSAVVPAGLPPFDFVKLRGQVLSGQASLEELEGLALALVKVAVDLLDIAPDRAELLHDGLKILRLYLSGQKTGRTASVGVV
jgi:hypothetical protein